MLYIRADAGVSARCRSRPVGPNLCFGAVRELLSAQRPRSSTLGRAHYVLFVDTTINTSFILAVVVSTSVAIKSCLGGSPTKPEDDFNRRCLFGIVPDGGDWEVMLKKRATVSASKMRRASQGVPEMSLREYERWKEGVRLAFATLLPSCWLTCSHPPVHLNENAARSKWASMIDEVPTCGLSH